MITKISCGRGGQIVYHFDNGNEVSFLWAWGSYSDNNMRTDLDVVGLAQRQQWETTRVEVYSMGEDNNGFTKWLKRKYGNNPAGYVDVNDMPAIIKRADKAVKDEPLR